MFRQRLEVEFLNDHQLTEQLSLVKAHNVELMNTNETILSSN